MTTTYRTGPFRGVDNTQQPYDDEPAKLVDAYNTYIPDPTNGSEVLARPGYNVVTQFGAPTPPGQGIFTHVNLAGQLYNFFASGGKLYRFTDALTSYFDVTPAGSPIDASARVYFTNCFGQLVISDGVNRPWIASNFGAAPPFGPMTSTPIDFDGAGVAWSAFGQPEVYAGSLFFIINSVGGVLARSDIAWSVPGDPTLGYQQLNYDFRWTLFQTGSGSINAVKGTNVAFYYWRDESIGALTGTPGPDLQQTATHDVVSVNVGTLAPATVQLFGDKIYFCDITGRPWMFVVGGSLEPIWQQLRSVVSASTSTYPLVTAAVASATILPELNLYIVAIWSPVAGSIQSPQELQVFDANTGTYVGRWTFALGTGTNAGFDAIGTLNNGAEHVMLAALAGPVSVGGGATSTRPWLQSFSPAGIPIDTEDGVDITTEGGITLALETVVPLWRDFAGVPDIRVVTQRLGFSDTTVLNVDRGTVITGTSSPCTIRLTTSTVANVLEGTTTPAASLDGTYRLPFGADVQGRGVQVTVAPTTANEQWALYSVSVDAVPSLAGPEEA